MASRHAGIGKTLGEDLVSPAKADVGTVDIRQGTDVDTQSIGKRMVQSWRQSRAANANQEFNSISANLLRVP